MDTQAMLPTTVEKEKERSHAGIGYFLSCLSALFCQCHLAIPAYILAYKAERTRKLGDDRTYRMMKFASIIVGITGVICGITGVVLFFYYIFPVWYKDLYFNMGQLYPWETPEDLKQKGVNDE